MIGAPMVAKTNLEGTSNARSEFYVTEGADKQRAVGVSAMMSIEGELESDQ